MLAKHYAPRTPLLLVTGPDPLTREAMLGLVAARSAAGERVGVLAGAEDAFQAGRAGAIAVEDVGSRRRPDEVGQRLFAALRALDEAGLDVIVARDFGRAGLAAAIHDRLTRAASHIVTVDER